MCPPLAFIEDRVLRVTSAIYLGVPAPNADHCGIDVEDVILTDPTNARYEKGHGIAEAIPTLGCVYLPKTAGLISQYALSCCPVERCTDLDEHQTVVRQLFSTRYRCNSGLPPSHGITCKGVLWE